MKTLNSSRIRQRAAWALGTALMLAHHAAQACPGCKQATEGRGAVPLNGASVGFGLSIFFMIFMIVAILSGLGFMMYRSCRVIAAQQRETLARLEAAETGMSGGMMARA